MWSRKIQLILESKGVWKIISGEEEASAKLDMDSYERRNDIALTTLLLSIEESVLRRVFSNEEPCKAWETVQEVFQTVSQSIKTPCRKTICALKFQRWKQ